MRRPVIDFGPLSQKWTMDIGGGGDSSGVQNPMGYSSQSTNSDCDLRRQKESRSTALFCQHQNDQNVHLEYESFFSHQNAKNRILHG